MSSIQTITSTQFQERLRQGGNTVAARIRALVRLHLLLEHTERDLPAGSPARAAATSLKGDTTRALEVIREYRRAG